MMTLLGYYRKTWWLWLLFAATVAALGYCLSPIFFLGLPILIAYSVIFGIVRVNEINRDRDKAIKNVQ